MLIIGLIVAAILYGVLYWIYLMTQSQAPSAISTLHLVDRMVSLPEPSVFFLLRWLLIITAIYVLGDFILHPARRKFKLWRQKKRDAEYDKTVFRGAKPVVPPPSSSDDTLPHF